MAFCNQCGAELAASAKFCSACGHPVGMAKAAPVNAELLRALSGVELTDKGDDPVRCPECGSAQIHSQRRWGLATGFLRSNVTLVCLKCGHKFRPGEG